jgi:hypothetical protein
VLEARRRLAKRPSRSRAATSTPAQTATDPHPWRPKRCVLLAPGVTTRSPSNRPGCSARNEQSRPATTGHRVIDLRRTSRALSVFGPSFRTCLGSFACDRQHLRQPLRRRRYATPSQGGPKTPIQPRQVPPAAGPCERSGGRHVPKIRSATQLRLLCIPFAVSTCPFGPGGTDAKPMADPPPPVGNQALQCREDVNSPLPSQPIWPMRRAYDRSADGPLHRRFRPASR